MTPPDPAGPSTPWRFEVDADEIDLSFTFADGEAVLEFEVDEDDIDRVAPGQRAELRIRGAAADSGPYAAGHVVGPVRWVEEDGERYPIVEVGLDLVAGAHVEPMSVATDDAIVLPALEVRLPADTLLVVEASDGGWTVVRGTADMTDVEELPDRHRTFIDAVEYVASVAQQAARDLPVVDLDDELEAVAIFDAEGGVYVVVKDEPSSYALCWLDDDGTLDEVDRYASLKEAILLPVLDEELFGTD